MSNITPINAAATSIPGSLATCLKNVVYDIQMGTIDANVAIDALEEIEDQMAMNVNDDNRGVYATLVLIRDRLRRSIKAIEQASERARDALVPTSD